MTRSDAGDPRAHILLIILAAVAGFAAVGFEKALAFPWGFALSLWLWWLALTATAVSAVSGSPDGESVWGPLRQRLAAGAAIVFLHGLLVVACLLPAVAAWRHAPSLATTLAIAVAATIALLVPWRLWPVPALALRETDTGDDPVRPAGRRLGRAFKAARSLTGERDLFLSHGLPVLALHSVLVLLPAVLLLFPVLPWSIRVLAIPLAIAVAWIVYRYVFARSHAALDLIRRIRAEDEPSAAPMAPIPANALMRAVALREALREGAIERALAIIDAGTDPTVPALPDEIDQRDALTIAATLNDSRPLRAMIAAGADVNHRCHGSTPLLAATRDSYYGRPETVLALVANGADLTVRDEAGQTPLHHAALSAEPAVAAVLLDAGAPIDAIDDQGYTALARACAAGNATLVPLLLERRAALSPDGSLPALCAAADAPDDDPAIIARLLRAKALPDVRDQDERTPLHHAVLAGHVEIARALVAGGAAVDARDREGRTALHMACRLHDADAPIVALLRSSGADADIADADGVTALMLLSRRRSPSSGAEDAEAGEAGDTIESLLANGRQAAVQAWLKTATPSQRAELALVAVQQGMARSMAHALAVPLPVDIRLPDGRRLVDVALLQWPATHALLHVLPSAGVAVSGGACLTRLLARPGDDHESREDVALAWLDAGADSFADPDGAGGPLHHAVALGLERLALRLMERGVDARRGDRAGVTPLHLALRHPDDLAVRLVLALLRHGADPDAPSGSGETPLGLALDANRPLLIDWLRWRGWRLPGRRLAGHDVVEAAQFGDLDAVRRLLALGLDINGRDHQGCTALIRAAGGGHRTVLDELLQRGADTAARAHSGTTALVAALLSGHDKLIEQLIEHGAAVDQRLANEATALIVAAACGRLASIERLLSVGADIGARDAAGNTALHAAAGFAFGCADGDAVRVVFLRLIAAGADVDAANGAGLTPLHIACGAAAAVRANGAGIDAALDVLLSRAHTVAAVDSRGCAALHYAAAHGQLVAVRRLLARGAEAARRDQGGWTAEHYAAHYGYTEVAQVLQPAPRAAALPLRPG